MASIAKSKQLLFYLSLQLCFCLLFLSTLAFSSGQNDGLTINGRVKIPNSGSRDDLGLAAKTSNIKVILNGGQRVTFLRPDGYFSFHNVPDGTHLLEVAATGYFFSPVRVIVSGAGKVRAALTDTSRGLTELSLEPLREEDYYEKRGSLNVGFVLSSLVKSPMGLMMVYMVLAVFVMPKLMQNMDPDEMRRAQEQMRGRGGSIANLLSGATAKRN